MAAWRDAEGRAMLDSLARLRVDASRASAQGDEEAGAPIDPRPLLVKAFGKDVVDRSLGLQEPPGRWRGRRGRRQSMEFEDLHVHTETGKLQLPPTLTARLGGRGVTSPSAVASACAEPLWVGDPEAIQSVRRPLRSVEQQRRHDFLQHASASPRARSGTFSHADRRFIRAKLSPLTLDKPGSPSSPKSPRSPLPSNRLAPESPKGDKHASAPSRKISAGGVTSKDSDLSTKGHNSPSNSRKISSHCALGKESPGQDKGHNSPSTGRKVSTHRVPGRDSETPAVHTKGRNSPSVSRKISGTSAASGGSGSK